MLSSWLKVFSFFGWWFAVWLPVSLIVSRSLDWQPNEIPSPKQKLVLLASLYILIPAVLGWEIKLKEPITLIYLGLSFRSQFFPHLLWGLILSLVSLTLVFSIESASNLVNWRRQNVKQLLSSCLPILVLSLLISLAEELVFRGYVFSTLLLGNSRIVAAIGSSIIFAVLHLIWERKQTLLQIPGLCLMGMVLVLARVVGDDTIYLPIGLHAGWIWGLTCIDSAELITYNNQSHWMTGMERQPLAGVAGILCLTVTALAVWGIAKVNLLWL